MNAKLLLFLVLLCFPTQPFYIASGLSISGITKFRRILEKTISNWEPICQFVGIFERGSLNCSLAPSAVSYAVNTDQTTPEVGVDGFTINLSVGGDTTPQNVSLILDTTLDYTFMLCTPCSDTCSTNLTVYDPSLSNTLSNYTCLNSECPSLKDYVSCSGGDCMYNYNESVSSEGPLVKDTFNFGTSPYPFVFGCGDMNTGNYEYSLGFLGLGSGGLSLLSQTNFSKFSYCFGSSGNSAFLAGSAAQLNTNSGASTELLNNTLAPRLYYVNFTGVSLGGESVDIPSSNYLPQPDGTGGMLLTSTYAYTYIESSAYDALKDAFVNEMSSFSQVDGSEYGLDLCFAIPAGQQVTVPQLTLHFDGTGGDMNPFNYSYFETNSDMTVGCLLLLPIKRISVLGYMMQYDTQMIYDVSKQRRASV